MPGTRPKSVRLLLTLSLAGLWMTGCVCTVHPANPPLRYTVRILAPSPARYLLRVEHAQVYRVGFDGLVPFEVPPLPAGCAVYLFGMVKVADHSPEAAPAIEVLRDGRVVRRLSLKKLAKLPRDSDGSRLLRLR